VTGPLLVIDADALMHRAYHSMPPVKGLGGRPVNALLGFTNMLLSAWDSLAPRAVCVGIDSREPGYRNELLPRYQAQRDEFDTAIVEQLDDLQGYLEAFGILAARPPRAEADDAVATLATREGAAGGTALVLTSDRDAFQLVSDRVTVVRPVKGVSEVEHVDSHRVVEIYGVLPGQVVDLIALRGDPSDNIPGARGIGPKTAAKLLQAHGDLDGVLDARPDLNGDQLRLYRQVATMQRDLPYEPPADGSPDWAAGAEAARERGILRLADRLDERAAA
jgi:DNA polymerase I